MFALVLSSVVCWALKNVHLVLSSAVYWASRIFRFYGLLGFKNFRFLCSAVYWASRIFRLVVLCGLLGFTKNVHLVLSSVVC